MSERLIETSYRSRFEGAQRGREQLEALYADMTKSFDPRKNALLVGAARPRTHGPISRRRERHEIAQLTNQAQNFARYWLGIENYQPLTDVTGYGAFPGLRGWIVPPSEHTSWRRARAAIFDDGAVGLAWEAGGHRYGAEGKDLPAYHVPADAVEGFVAALLALIKAVADDDPAGDVEVLLGIEWQPSDFTPVGDERLFFAPSYDFTTGSTSTTPLGGIYRPVHRLIDPTPEEKVFIQTVVDVATDCLNQAGVRHLAKLTTELPPRR